MIVDSFLFNLLKVLFVIKDNLLIFFGIYYVVDE